LQGRSEPSTESTRRHALSLLGKVVDGFSLHPFFFILNTKAYPFVFPFAHQAELLFRSAFRRPVRILVGDEIGLGKTLEAILIAKFLEKRDGIRRALFLVPRILIEQWRSELKRFGVHAKVIERENVHLLAQQNFPDKWYIASIDLIKKEKYKPEIIKIDWDIVIVDEAHRVGKTKSGQKDITERYELVEELAKKTNRNIILLSATPHRGHPADYLSRLKLVDHYLVGREELDKSEFYRLTYNAIVTRRTKMDVNEVYERKQIFNRARFIARVINATEEEREFNDLLFKFLRDKLLKYYEYIEEEPRALPLLLALVTKRASSSPYAAVQTLGRILQRRSQVVSGKAMTLFDASMLDKEAEKIVESYLGLGFEDYSEVEEQDKAVEPDDVVNKFAEKCSALLAEQDLSTVEKLFSLSKEIVDRGDSRLRSVLRLIREHLEKEDKVVLFTEYRDTAKYIYDRLNREMPDIVDKTALITSEKIVIPRWGSGKEPSIEDLKRHLQSGLIKLVISTDVASEGLNLQMANIVVNYEPTWSPVKAEQRLGRVWRLGQEKEVTAYTLFLAVRSDKDVLDVLYKKLLAWGRSLQESRVAIGEEVVIDMMTEEGSTVIPVDAARGTPKYSEYKALLTYIREGRSGLENYVQGIINALGSLKRSLEAVGLARRDIAFRTDRLLDEVLGDFRGEEAEKTLKELFIAAAKLKGLSPEVKGDRIFVGRYKLDNIYDFYSGMKSLLPSTDGMSKPVCILSSAQIEGFVELHLFKVTLYFKDKPVYSETVGLGVKADSTKLLRGRKLIDIIIRALSPDQLVLDAQEYYVPEELLQDLKVRASKEVLNKVVQSAVTELKKYMSELERLSLSSRHKDWEPRDQDAYGDMSEYLGVIIFTTPKQGESGVSPSTKIEEIRGAMRIAMEYERMSGRTPEDIGMKGHFNILSRNPRTGEVRFIEVMGSPDLNPEVKLKEPESNVYTKEGISYWLYMIYGIGTEKPRLLAIQHPAGGREQDKH